MTTLTLLQLNLWYGQLIESAIAHIKSRRYDIVTLQEVASPHIKIYRQGNVGIDCLDVIARELPEYTSHFALMTRQSDDPTSYIGNLTLVRRPYSLTDSTTLYMRPYEELSTHDLIHMSADRLTLLTRICGWDTIVTEQGSPLVTIGNIHGPWGADDGLDSPEKTRQYKSVEAYIQGIQGPWILAGDTNMPPHTQAMRDLERLGTSLVQAHLVTNTMNKSRSGVFKWMPSGTAVDHIYLAPSIRYANYRVIDDVELSDHYAVEVELSLV